MRKFIDLIGSGIGKVVSLEEGMARLDVITEDDAYDADLVAPDTSETEDWGQITIPLKFVRHDVSAYETRGRGGMRPVRKIRARLMLGHLFVGHYETVKGSSKVIVTDSQRNKVTVSSEKEAQDLLASWIPKSR